MNGMEAIIACREVSVRRGGRDALRGVDLTVPQGVFVLLGNNGAGKSTLISALLDFIPVLGGEIFLWGRPHGDYRDRARLAYLPERFTPPWYLTGREFLLFSQRMRHQPYDEARARDWAQRLTLEPEALSRPVRSFSKGMTQKLGLAAVFLAEVELLVLDEPMSGLDPHARHAVMQAMTDVRAAGRTIFMSSHALADAEQLMARPDGRLAILSQGELRYQGQLAPLLERTGARTLEEAYLSCTAPIPAWGASA